MGSDLAFHGPARIVLTSSTPSMQAVANANRDVFRLVKESLPGLEMVGTAWNPAEANSRAFVMAAREACGTLGITLLEANLCGHPRNARSDPIVLTARHLGGSILPSTGNTITLTV